MKRSALLIFLGMAVALGEEQKSRSWQLTEVNAKIADLQKQLDYWQEKRKQLLEVPDSVVEAKSKPGQRTYTGPRNGKYHYSASGRKIYERKFYR